MKSLKCLCLMLSMSFFLGAVAPVTAQATTDDVTEYKLNTDSRVGEAFDRYLYAMNVEWDQQDPVFMDHAQTELEKKLAGLSAEGVSASEFLKYVESGIKDAALRAEFTRLVHALRAQNVPEEQAVDMIKGFVEKSQAEGANFMGGRWHSCRWVCKIVTVIIIVAVIRAIWRHHDRRDHDHNDNVVAI